MSNLIPYFVLAVVALGFFAVCYAVFSGDDGESKAKEKSYKNISNKNNPKAHNDVIFATESQEGNVTITHTSGTNVYTASIPDTVETVVGEEREPAEPLVDPIDTSYNKRSTLKSNSSHVSEGEYALALGSDNGTPIGSDNGTPIGDETIVMTAVSDFKQANQANQGVTPLVDKTIVLDVVTDELLNNANNVEDTIAMGESVEAFEADEADSIDATQMIGGANEIQTAEGPSVLDETRLFDASEIEAQLAATSLTEEEEPHGQWAKAAHEDKCVELAIAPFVHSFGVLHGDTQHYVESITRDALAALNITKIVEVNALLENIVIQEALMSMQKAYAATNTEWMKSAALGAFLDVVQSPKSSTPYLVAFDALRVLPHLTLGHFQVMALTLLLQYSRNSNNYGLIHFQHYVEKYIEPFISDLPRNDSFYRQLDYLRCTQEEQEPITLCQVLSNSYPFVFNYRGFSKEELFRATDGHGVDPRYVVRSLNSNLYKLALVDESLAPQFFRQTRISNAMVQRDLLALMKSKPTAFRGQEARDIMDDISPVLLDLADVFDSTPMSKISLTLLGLYLGRAHVKATIGEEFDLSHWF